MIKKIDIPQSTAIDASVLWGGINDNVLAAKINELIDVVNKQQDIIRQIGEWGSSKGEWLWCDTLTEFNPEKPTVSKMENVQKETFVSIDEALKMGKKVATMQNKSIWHTADEKPMLQRDIILCGDGWSMAIDIIPETVNNICWKNVEKWCYVDDLLALETENKDLSDKIEKLETELERTRKALDVAVDALKEYTDEKRYDWERCYELHSAETAKNALEQITALEQKD